MPLKATLGDLFPPAQREAFCERHLVPGSVFRVFVHDTKPPKIKRFVVIGVNRGVATIGCLYFNSQVNLNCLGSPELLALQVEFSALDREFLNGDSFLDCSTIHEISVEYVAKIFALYD